MRWGEAGFGLLSAIFLLAVISAAGAATVRITGVQRNTASLSLMALRAHEAAASGVEWVARRALTVPGSCPTGVTTVNGFTLNEGGLTGFQVTTRCESDVHVEGAKMVTRFHVTSTGEWKSFGDRDYVKRRLEVTLSDDS